MKKKPKSQEYRRFENALSQVLKVSKVELDAMLEAERKTNEGKPKRGPKPKSFLASDRASNDVD